jgi:hypothetical protein
VPEVAESTVAVPDASTDVKADAAPVFARRPSNGSTPYRGGGDRGGGDRGDRGDRGPRRDTGAPRQIQPKPAAAPEDAPESATEAVEPAAARSGCTLAQMRRFIKSRPYIPVHELRRRFLIEGMEDEVSPMATGQGMLYVGLPEREAGFLGELVKNGEVGCELLLDPTSPGVIGVFPMRPVARQ